LELLGKWNLRNYVNYDQIRWTNFYGLGNETLLSNKNRDFYRTRSEEFIARVTTDRVFNNKHKFSTGIYFNTYRILNDTNRFLIKQSGLNNQLRSINENFGAAVAGYVFQHLNDSVLPTKGISFQVDGTFIDNLKKNSNNVAKIGASTNFFIPISKKFSIFTRVGGSTLSGTPQFFQYNRIGGSNTIRGYQRDRFYGNSTAFNQNELRYITNVKSFLFNGKFGVFGLYDAGRTWLKGETSKEIHTAYGGGIILSPFNRITVSLAYAKSPEDTNIHIALLKPF
ncbi:MAG: BamA/TamA family outer membrane protein, partial [Pedobacter sp.]|nr:BamA/TamA family outer membrane protein [Pedobacter sp.]